MPRSARSGALAAVILLFATTACGSDEPTAEELQDEISEQLVEGGLDEEQADCVAGVIVEEIGTEELQDVDFSAEEPPEDLQEDIAAATRTALETCEGGAEGEPTE